MRKQTRSISELLEPFTPRRYLAAQERKQGARMGSEMHEFYRYVQDFPAELTYEWIERFLPTHDRDSSVVLDPFCGSGTVPLVCQELGIHGQGSELSPLMLDVARAKCDWSLRAEPFVRALESAIRRAPKRDGAKRWAEIVEKDKLLEKWIDGDTAQQLCGVSMAIENAGCSSQLKRALRVVLASVILPLSYMSLRPNICYRKTSRDGRDPFDAFHAAGVRFSQCLADSNLPERARARIIGGDARSSRYPRRADLVFTSPPYPNDMEYVHQTRLELALCAYLLGRESQSALKRKMISSSVKLVYKDNEYQHREGVGVESVRCLVEDLEVVQPKNWGWNASRMSAHYFGGMRLVLRNLLRVCKPGALLGFVVGDSWFNGVKIQTDRLLADVAVAEGYEKLGISVFRTRTSTKHAGEMVESVLVLRAPAGVGKGSHFSAPDARGPAA